MSTFYDELIKNDFYNEKIASMQAEDVEKALEVLEDEQIEALAEELDLFVKEAEQQTIEEAATEDARNQETNAEKNLKGEHNEPDKVPSEDSVTNKQKADADKKVTKEDDQTEQNKGETEKQPQKTDDQEYALDDTQKSAAAILEALLKEGAAEEEIAEIEKEAFEYAEEVLNNAGYSVADYVYSFVGNEKVALNIADTAEKLAYVSDQPTIKVARDLIVSMANLLS